MVDLDDIDYGILQMLQRDARHLTPVDMAERLPVTDQTIRNRIENMEAEGVIEGYVPVIDYQRAEFSIRLQYVCSAPVRRRDELAERALEIANVVRVEEMLSARENLQILAVTDNSEEINTITEELDGLGLTIESERLMRYAHSRPFNHFGVGMVSEE